MSLNGMKPARSAKAKRKHIHLKNILETLFSKHNEEQCVCVCVSVYDCLCVCACACVYVKQKEIIYVQWIICYLFFFSLIHRYIDVIPFFFSIYFLPMFDSVRVKHYLYFLYTLHGLSYFYIYIFLYTNKKHSYQFLHF